MSSASSENMAEGDRLRQVHRRHLKRKIRTFYVISQKRHLGVRLPQTVADFLVRRFFQFGACDCGIEMSCKEGFQISCR